jgi:hypothetical protein
MWLQSAQEQQSEAGRNNDGGCRTERAQPRLSSLISSLIYPRTTPSTGDDLKALSMREDRSDLSQTVILGPEKRKAGGSIPSLTTGFAV